MFAWPGAAPAQQAPLSFETSPLRIVSESGAEHHFTVELALTQPQRSQGLMFRENLAPDAGMLFDYKRPVYARMWMKNTLIPLDMLFIKADGRIESIRKRAVPHSLETIGSKRRVRAVLELLGGTVDRLEISPGDRVVHPIFGQ